jgi:hypothetical protein
MKISVVSVEYGHVQNWNYQFWDMLHLFPLVILALEAKKEGSVENTTPVAYFEQGEEKPCI